MKSLKVYIFLVFFLLSCANPRKHSRESSMLFNVDISKSEMLVHSDSSRITRIVPLQTNEKSVMSIPLKIFISDSLIVVYSRNIINIFDREGSFIRRIGTKGNGPGEYAYITDMDFEEQTKLIYLLNQKRQMLIFDIDGQLINKLNTGFRFDSFCKAKRGYWVYQPNNFNNPHLYALRYMDENFKELANYFPQKQYFGTLSNSKFFQDSALVNYFIYPFSNIVYRLTDSIPLPYLQIDFGKKMLPYEAIREMSNTRMYEQLNTKDYLGKFDKYVLCNNRFYIQFSEMDIESISYFARFDINHKSVNVYNSCQNYLPYSSLFLNTPISSYKDELIFAVSPDDLDEDTLKKLGLLKYYQNIKYESNPLLIFLKDLRK